VDGEVTTKTFAELDTTYHNLLRVPKHSFGLNAGYQITPALFISANLKAVGERKDWFFDMNDFTTKSVTMVAYQLLDVYAEYKLRKSRLKIFVDAKNVLDQEYYEIYGYSTMGVNVVAGVSFNM
jgi:vitamin B12 transporter